MARIVPKIKQTSGGDLQGGSLVRSNGRVYTGPYVQNYLGEYFTGQFLDKSSQPLTLFYPEDTLELTPLPFFVYYYVEITERVREKGYLTRYFIQDGVNGRVKEVSENNYRRGKQEGGANYHFYHCTWYLSQTGEEKNRRSIEEGEKVIKGIGRQVLKSPSQFVS